MRRRGFEIALVALAALGIAASWLAARADDSPSAAGSCWLRSSSGTAEAFCEPEAEEWECSDGVYAVVVRQTAADGLECQVVSIILRPEHPGNPLRHQAWRLR